MANDTVKFGVEAEDRVTLPLKQIESSIIRFVGAVSAAMATFKVAMYQVTAAADLQVELLNIQKTTTFADSTIKEFSKSLVDMSKQVNVTAVDLAKIAAIGGQLGLGAQGSEALRQFTETTARFSSVLDVAVEDAGNGIAKITNIFDIALLDAERIASAFNELSNNSTASGADLIDVVQRLGDAGGTINLQQSLGLAATGRDFGLTLETIGTSFVKVFADMQSKAEDFGKFLGISTKEWTEIVEGDGVAALKLYLDALRKLRSDERAYTIEKLSGGGRIFSLVNKLANDTSNDILNRNIQSATDGWISGTSAIQEQETVLKGFTAQVQILKNEFTALAIGLGDNVLPALTGIVIGLQNWLNDPGVVSGIKTFAEQFNAIAGSIADVVRWVAQLNINWGNLVPFLIAIAGLKLAKVIAEWVNSLALFGAALRAADKVSFTKTIAGLKSVGAEVDRLGAKAATIAGFKAGISSLSTGISGAATGVANYAGFGDQIAASKSLKEAELASEAAKMAEKDALRARDTASHQLAANRQAADTDKANQAQILSDAKRVAYIKAADAQVTATKAFNLARQTAQMEQYNALAALEAQKQVALAASAGVEEAAVVIESYKQRSAAIKTHYAGVIVAANQTMQAEILAANETATAEVAAATRRSNNLRRIRLSDLAADRAILRAREADLAAAEATRVATEEAEAAARQRRFSNSTNFITGAIRNLGKVIAVALSAFVWVTLIASLLEMLGLLPSLTGMFFKLTDAIGLTSKATREARQEMRKLADEAEETRKKLEAQNDEYLQMLQKRGALTAKGVQTQIEGAKGSTDQTAAVAVDALTRGATALNFGAGLAEAQKNAPRINEAANKSYRDAIKVVEDYKAALVKLSSEQDAINTRIAAGLDTKKGLLYTANAEAIANTRVALAKAEADAAAAASAITNTSQRAIQENAVVVQNVTKGVLESSAELSKLVTQDISNVVNNQLVEMTGLDTAIKGISKSIDTERQKLQALPTDNRASTEQARADIQATIDLQEVSRRRAQARLVELNTEVTKIAEGLSTGEQKAIEGLKSISAEALVGLRRLLGIIEKEAGFSGEALKTATDAPKASGVSPLARSGDSRSDLSRARFRLAQEQLLAELKLIAQARNEELKINEFYYQRGLISLDQYLDAKTKAERMALEETIRLKELELKAAKEQEKLATKGSAKLGLQADVVRINGDLEVLRRKRGVDDREAARDRVKAEEEANDKILQRQADFLEEYGSNEEAARIRSGIANRELLRRAEAELARAQQNLTNAAPGEAVARAWEAVDAAEFDLKTIQITIETSQIKAGIDQVKQQLENGLELGSISPESVVEGFIDLAAAAESRLAPALDLIRERMSTASAAEMPALEAALKNGQEAIDVYADSIRNNLTGAIDAFKNRIGDGLNLGSLAIPNASAQITEFASVLETQLNKRIEDLQIRIAGASGDLRTRLIGQLAEANREVLKLRDSVYGLSTALLAAFGRNIDLKQQIGLLGALEAGESKVAAARREAENYRIRTMKEVAALQKQIADNPGDENAKARLEEINLQYLAMRNTLSEIATSINTEVRSAFTGFFESIANGTATVSEAFTQLGLDILATSAKASSEALVDSLFNSALSGEGSIGDVFAGILNPGSRKTRGESKNNPLYVQDIGRLPGTGGAEGSSILGDAESAGITGWLSDLGSSLQTNISALFSGITGSLGGLLQGVMAGLQGLFSGGGGSGLFGAVASAFGFADGGYTGDGGKYQPKGVVHGGEYVFSKKAVSRIGVGALEMWHRVAKGGFVPRTQRVGYAEGGLVDIPEIPVPTGGQSSMALRMVNVVDPKLVNDFLSSPSGEKVVLNHISRNSTVIKNLLGG